VQFTSHLFKEIWKKRWTRFWTKLYTIPSAFLAMVSAVNHYVTNPEFKTYLSVLDVPKEVTIALAVVGMVALLAEDH